MQDKIHLEQADPQGDIILPSCFLIVVENLLTKITQSKNIKGVKICKYVWILYYNLIQISNSGREEDKDKVADTRF